MIRQIVLLLLVLLLRSGDADNGVRGMRVKIKKHWDQSSVLEKASSKAFQSKKAGGGSSKEAAVAAGKAAG
jgi:hypothetical protein